MWRPVGCWQRYQGFDEQSVEKCTVFSDFYDLVALFIKLHRSYDSCIVLSNTMRVIPFQSSVELCSVQAVLQGKARYVHRGHGIFFMLVSINSPSYFHKLQLVCAVLHNLENLSLSGTTASHWKAHPIDLPAFSRHHKYVFSTAEPKVLVFGPSVMCCSDAKRWSDSTAGLQLVSW